MAEIGRWNGYKFVMSPTKMRGFTGLTIKGACETESKTSGKQTYIARKAGKAAEVGLTVVLSAALGVNVRTEALKLVKSATAGEKAYFYVGRKKLLPCKLMLVDASVKETEIGKGNRWISAQVQMTMKQCDKSGATADGSGSRRRSVRSRAPANPGSNTEVDAITGADPSAAMMLAKLGNTVRKTVNSAVDTINRLVSAARKQTIGEKQE